MAPGRSRAAVCRIGLWRTLNRPPPASPHPCIVVPFPDLAGRDRLCILVQGIDQDIELFRNDHGRHQQQRGNAACYPGIAKSRLTLPASIASQPTDLPCSRRRRRSRLHPVSRCAPSIDLAAARRASHARRFSGWPRRCFLRSKAARCQAGSSALR